MFSGLATWHGVACSCDFNLRFLIISEIGPLFMCLLVIQISAFVKNLLNSLAHVSLRSSFFLLIHGYSL